MTAVDPVQTSPASSPQTSPQIGPQSGLATGPHAQLAAGARSVDPWTRPRGAGAINATLARIVLGRTVRDPGALIFAVALPLVIFLMFGTNAEYADLPAGRGTVGAVIMTCLGLYGAFVSTVSTGTAVSIERATGWSRQLRLTPLSPAAYLAVKGIGGLLVGAISIAVVYTAGYASGIRMDADLWVTTAAIAWIGSAVFAAFGLFMGFLFKSENAMKIVGPGMAILAFLGGLFSPIDPESLLGRIAPYTPLYGLRELALTPYDTASFTWGAVANVLIWLAFFSGGAAYLMSRDTSRV